MGTDVPFSLILRMKNGKWPTSHRRGSSEILIWGPRKCGGGRGLVGVQLGEPRFRRVHAPGTLPDTPSGQAHVCTPSREGPCGWAPRTRSAGKGMHPWSPGVPRTVLPERHVLHTSLPGSADLSSSRCPQRWSSTSLETCRSRGDTAVSSVYVPVSRRPSVSDVHPPHASPR